MTDEQAAAWLAGFIDGEGCVYYRNVVLANGKRHQHRVMTLTNTDPVLVAHAEACLAQLGIEYAHVERPGASPHHRYRYTIEVRKGAALWRLRSLVPIVAPEKRRRLDECLAFYHHLQCRTCGVLHDERTEGCYDCRKRHQMRGYAQAARDRAKAREVVA